MTDVTFYGQNGEELETGSELYIDILERGVSVQIVVGDGNVTVNLWPLSVADVPMASASATT